MFGFATQLCTKFMNQRPLKPNLLLNSNIITRNFGKKLKKRAYKWQEKLINQNNNPNLKPGGTPTAIEHELMTTDKPAAAFRDLVEQIDTTLTPEEKERVEKIKLKYIKRKAQKFSPYREIPTEEEQELALPRNQSFRVPYRPFIPPNAEELVDW